MTNPAEEPKLIIDEDWKTQVQREKEELKQKLEEEAARAEAAPAQAASPTQQSTSNRSQAPDAPPPASFQLLVTTLATQAMAAMGLLPSEAEEAPAVRLDFAKHFIDMLSVLEQKTAGNLADAEKNYLQEALHQLRMAFVAVSKQPTSVHQS